MASDPKKPYGDVTYADPGYQSDGKKRYPLDTEAHCKAAWSYINQGGNASAYTPEQLKAIKGRIKAALTRLGVQVAESKAAAVDIDVVRAVALPQSFEEAAEPDDGLGLMTGRFSAIGEWYPVESKF